MAAISLSSVPQHYPDCCVALSQSLIESLASILPKSPELVLSIGSGSGLFEFLLHRHDPRINLRAVEVNNTLNKYLAESCVWVVGGTWATHTAASEASSWIFVYPREPKLVRLYIETHVSPLLRCIIWIGPRNDWHDYASLFVGPSWDVNPLEELSTVSYELVVLVRVCDHS
ncbi:hypothetical protein K461DRAFT_3479 [Myriangium duriaei CBS 260.36]|uniref:Uncharacterized protein n=1 Tax=Myriangium duriaei CBS 260.36 TaxID=1168546 RepID=A0A9P4MP04_9PEZI|nr:hypothetical protein K461DRAFT_3479 [Myriangium duriaei CBS 260.36]